MVSAALGFYILVGAVMSAGIPEVGSLCLFTVMLAKNGCNMDAPISIGRPSASRSRQFYISWPPMVLADANVHPDC